MSGFMSKASFVAKSVPTTTNSGTNATASTAPIGPSLFAANTAGTKPFLNDTIGTRGAKDDNPFIELPVRKLFKPQSVSSSTGRQGPGGGPTTSMFGRSRLLQKSVTGKSLSTISTSGPGTSSSNIKKNDQKTGAHNKQRLVLTRVYPINSNARFFGDSSSNTESSDPVASEVMATSHPVFNSGTSSVPTPTSHISSAKADNDCHFAQHHPSTTPKAPPPNREFYQNLTKVAAPRFSEKIRDDHEVKDTSIETDNIVSEQSHTPIQNPPQRTVLPPSDVMAFARKSVMKHATSSLHSIFRKFNKNNSDIDITDTTDITDTPPTKPVHSSPQQMILNTEAPPGHNARMEIDHQPNAIVQPQAPRTIKPSDGFFVFQSQPRPDIPAKPVITETKAKPRRPIEHSVFSRALAFSKQPDPKKKDIPNTTPISTHNHPKLVDTSGLVLSRRPTLDPIPPREPQSTDTSTQSLDIDNPDLTDSKTFDLRAVLRMDSARLRYNLPGLTATLTPPSPPSKQRSSPYSVPSAHDREGLRFKRMTQFKARPLNPKLFTSAGDLGVPKIPKQPLTVPVSPVFSRRQVKIRMGSVTTVAATRLKSVIGAAKAEALQGTKPFLTVPPPRTRADPQASAPKTGTTTSHGLKGKGLRRPIVPTRPVPFQFATTELQRKRALFEPTTAEPRRELETFGPPR
ncbi:hypothetical protein BGZ93_001613 [Podila epicladia]|nr:hypothetical protein BGZ92_008117 [Podila epicladia]KAG0097922.1 hypothetical protein BGZ93_001613 [Podila epicladia]